jgi:hypothetical protein
VPSQSKAAKSHFVMGQVIDNLPVEPNALGVAVQVYRSPVSEFSRRTL